MYQRPSAPCLHLQVCHKNQHTSAQLHQVQHPPKHVPPLQVHLKQAEVSHTLCTTHKLFYNSQQLHSNSQVPWQELLPTPSVLQPAKVTRASHVRLQPFHMLLSL
eukprot:Gb_22664 [translate_table: standard]